MKMRNSSFKTSIIKPLMISTVKSPRKLRILKMKTSLSTRFCQKLRIQEFPQEARSVTNLHKAHRKREYVLLVLVQWWEKI